jgi:UDP-N-acetylglucosamine--N-acetylmuramyl-(pentapeptide) pyrophosphoryl-undecaprenol N-acetylglucosamine transferase
VAFAETASRLSPEAPVRVTGAVGRPGFEDDFGQRPGGRLTPRAGDGRPRMVVLGGIAGSTSLNEAMPAALRRLGEGASGWQVVHQSGSGWLTATERRYRDAGVEAVVVTYIDELAHLAREADLVVCPPGGSLMAELALAGLPAVLVPDSRRRDGLHEANARLAALRTGCPVVGESDGDLAISLAEGLRPLLADESLRETVSRRFVRLARPEASSLVAEACWEAMGWRATPRLRMAA